MLRHVRVAEQFREIESRLPADWADAQLVLTVDDAGRADRAAAILAPLEPGRLGSRVRLSVPRRGGRPDLLRRLLARLDRERIEGTLELVTAAHAAPERTPEPVRGWPPLEESWLAAVAALPEDWSDLYVELELDSSDHLERAALLLAPANPARHGSDLGFRFRVARSFGYGASPEMTARCLARLDEDGIRGRVRILRALSDTRPVATQGPVWYVGGKSV
jgi:hypothetical protein